MTEQPAIYIVAPGSSTPTNRSLPNIPESPLVYFAAPLTTYATGRYDRLFVRAQALYPAARVLDPRTLFPDTATWKAVWRYLVPLLHGLVFIRDDAGWIGAGVWQELRSAAWRRLPIACLDDPDGAPVPADQLRWGPCQRGEYRRYRRVYLPTDPHLPSDAQPDPLFDPAHQSRAAANRARQQLVHHVLPAAVQQALGSPNPASCLAALAPLADILSAPRSTPEAIWQQSYLALLLWTLLCCSQPRGSV